MKKWYILDREGTAQEASELPVRPADAKPEEGEAFRPWYKEHEHVHVENGRIEGIHAYGELDDLQNKLKNLLSKEKGLLEKFGDKEDINLIEATEFVG